MVIDGVDGMLKDPAFLKRMGYPTTWHNLMRNSWNAPGFGSPDEGEPFSHWRFDFGASRYGLKFFEANAVPVAGPESGPAQARWYHDMVAQGFWPNGVPEQWNNLTPDLTRSMGYVVKRAAEFMSLKKPVVYFAYNSGDTSNEDMLNAAYYAEACRQAGYEVRLVTIDAPERRGQHNPIGYRQDLGFYEDFGNETGDLIKIIYFLWPWDRLLRSPFGEQLVQHHGKFDSTGIMAFGPPWELAVSNQALNVWLWDQFGNDPARKELLLPSYFTEDKPSWLRSYIEKPTVGQEGAGKSIFLNGSPVHTSSEPREEGWPSIAQELTELPVVMDRAGAGKLKVVVSLWYAGHRDASCLSVRMHRGLITTHNCYTVPHIITGAPEGDLFAREGA
jgi:glutathionylspermidine synthase